MVSCSSSQTARNWPFCTCVAWLRGSMQGPHAPEPPGHRKPPRACRKSPNPILRSSDRRCSHSLVSHSSIAVHFMAGLSSPASGLHILCIASGSETAHCCSMAAAHTHCYLVITMTRWCTEMTRLLWTGDGLWPVYPMICHTYQSAVLQTLVSYGFPYHPWEENTTLSTQLSKILYRTQFRGGAVLHANSLNREMSACSRAGRSLSLLIFDIPLFLPGYLQPRNTNILADPLQGQIQNLFRYVIKPAATDIAFPKSDMGEIPSVEKATYSCWRISGDTYFLSDFLSNRCCYKCLVLLQWRFLPASQSYRACPPEYVCGLWILLSSSHSRDRWTSRRVVDAFYNNWNRIPNMTSNLSTPWTRPGYLSNTSKLAATSVDKH